MEDHKCHNKINEKVSNDFLFIYKFLFKMEIHMANKS